MLSFRRWRTSSFAVIRDLVQIALTVLVIVLGASAEELLPKVFGVGFPVLLAAVPVMVARCGKIEGLAFAVAAGAMEEALSFIPPMAGVSYFLAVAVVARYAGAPRALRALAYPAYQIWLSIWLVGIGGGIFQRLFLSFPIGLLTMFAIGRAVDWLCGKAALDEPA